MADKKKAARASQKAFYRRRIWEAEKGLWSPTREWWLKVANMFPELVQAALDRLNGVKR